MAPGPLATGLDGPLSQRALEADAMALGLWAVLGAVVGLLIVYLFGDSGNEPPHRSGLP